MNSALPIVDIYSWIAYLSVQRRIGLCEENCRNSVGKILFKKKKKKKTSLQGIGEEATRRNADEVRNRKLVKGERDEMQYYS